MLFKLSHAATMRGAFDRGVNGGTAPTIFHLGDAGFTVISTIDKHVFDVANDRIHDEMNHVILAAPVPEIGWQEMRGGVINVDEASCHEVSLTIQRQGP